MFFIRYLRCELRSRARQAVFIALGLAIGVGLVVTVTAASSGVKQAQSGVLHSLYGIGTDATVTKKPPPRSAGSGGNAFKVTPGGSQVCQGRTTNCKKASAGQVYDNLTSPTYGPLGSSDVTSAANQKGVSAAVGGLVLTDTQITIPGSVSSGFGGGVKPPKSFTVDGVDLSHRSLGPLSDASVSSGKNLTAADANANDALVDYDYARSNNLTVGSEITIAKKKFTVVGIIAQPQASNPPNLYIPLARAQALGTSQGKSLKNQVNTIYVTAASSSDISAVQKEISSLLPKATVTTPASLASQVSGSLSSTANLANDLGRWLSILVLIAAFAVACLLTMSAVSRRVREFGTLKALGWRSRRIIMQVMGESMAMGVLGAAAGVGLGFAGAAIIDQIAPKLSATVQTATGQQMRAFGPSGAQSTAPTIPHTVSVPMSASVTTGAIVAAVVLAIIGALLAGSFGSWRIAQLRPADALSKVA
jgi:putative ABC transport system permease protein